MAQEGENKLIDIQGIARGGSDLDCSDGMCNEVVGLVYEQGQLKPYSLESLGVEVTGYSRIYIHNTSAGKNYIFITDGGRVLWDSEVYIMSHKNMPYNPYADYSEDDRKDLYPRHEIDINLSTTTPNVSFLGNLMSIDCNNIYLYEGGTYNIKVRNGSVNFRASVGIKPNGYVLCAIACGNKELQEDERDAVVEQVRQAARKLNSCVGYSYLRYGIRNYNNEYIYLSNPVLVSDGDINNADEAKPPVDNNGNVKHYRPNDKGGRWDDLIAHSRGLGNIQLDDTPVTEVLASDKGFSPRWIMDDPSNPAEKCPEQLGKRWNGREGVTIDDFTKIKNPDTDYFCEEKIQFHYPNGDFNTEDYGVANSLCIVEDVDDGGVGWDVVTKAIGFDAYRHGTKSSRTDNLFESFFPKSDEYLTGKKQAMYVGGAAGRDIDRSWLRANGYAQRLLNVPTIRIDAKMPSGLENYILSVDILATIPVDVYETSEEPRHRACKPYKITGAESIINKLNGASSGESGAISQTYKVICRIPYSEIVKLEQSKQGTTYVIRLNGKEVWEYGEVGTDEYTVTGEEGAATLRWGVQYQYNSRLHVADISYESFLGAGASMINPNNPTLLNQWLDRLACHTTCYDATEEGKNPYRKWNALSEDDYKRDNWWYKTPDSGERLIPLDRFGDDVKAANKFNLSHIYPMGTPFSFMDNRISVNDIKVLDSGNDGAIKLYNMHKGNGERATLPSLPEPTTMRVHDATNTFFKRLYAAHTTQGSHDLIDFNRIGIRFNNDGDWVWEWYDNADDRQFMYYTPWRFYKYYGTTIPSELKYRALDEITRRIDKFNFDSYHENEGDMIGEELLMLVKSTRYSAKQTGAQKETVSVYNVIPVSLYALDLFNSICLPGTDWAKVEIVSISGAVYKAVDGGYIEKERKELPIGKVFDLKNTAGINDCKWIDNELKNVTLTGLFDVAKTAVSTTLKSIFDTVRLSIKSDDAPKYVFRVSNVNSLETFDIANEYYSGRGDVIGFASNSNDISTGQFGEYPLYVFTTEGVFSYKVDESGTKAYSVSSPVSRDVCNNRNSICETRDMVLFSSVRGLYCIRGGAVYHLSEIINGEPTDIAINDDTEWRKGNGLAVFNKAITSDSIVTARDAISENTEDSQIADFRTFLADGNTFLSYNYESDIVIASNTEKNYSYTIQLLGDNQCFVSKIHSRVNYSINNYPDDTLSCKSLVPTKVERKEPISVGEVVSSEIFNREFETRDYSTESVELDDESTIEEEQQELKVLNMTLDSSSLGIDDSVQDNPTLTVNVGVTSEFNVVNHMFYNEESGTYSSYTGDRFFVRCKNNISISEYTVEVRGENDELYYCNTESTDIEIANVEYIDSYAYNSLQGDNKPATYVIYTRSQSNPNLPISIVVNNGAIVSFRYAESGQPERSYDASEMESVLGCVWSLGREEEEAEGDLYSAVCVVTSTSNDSGDMIVLSHFVIIEPEDVITNTFNVNIPLTNIGRLSSNTYRISVTVRCLNRAERFANYYNSAADVPSEYYSNVSVISTVKSNVSASLAYKEEFKHIVYHDEEYVWYKDVYSDNLFRATYDGNVSDAKDVVIQTRPIKINNDTFKQAFRVSLRGDLNIEEGKTVGLYVMASNDCEKWMYIGGTEHSSSMGNPMVNIGTTIERFSYRYIMVVFAGRLMANSRIRAIEISKNYKYNKKLR